MTPAEALAALEAEADADDDAFGCWLDDTADPETERLRRDLALDDMLRVVRRARLHSGLRSKYAAMTAPARIAADTTLRVSADLWLAAAVNEFAPIDAPDVPADEIRPPPVLTALSGSRTTLAPSACRSSGQTVLR